MKTHYSKRYKKRIAELEIQVKQYSRMAAEAEKNSQLNLILFKREFEDFFITLRVKTFFLPFL